MRAITIPPTTASCILYHGQNILSRSYGFQLQLGKDPIALHTSQGFARDAEDVLRNHGIEVQPCPEHHIVAIVRVVGRPRKSDSPWARPGFHLWAIEVEDILSRPVPWRGGGSGLWSLDKDTHKYIYEQTKKAPPKRKALKTLVSVP